MDPQVPPTFLIAFPTLSATDDGRAHVLEHLVLCGSRAYPVKDLFSRAKERTLASFMNAYTSATATLYPFVSPHLADYRTLLPVYLDAVFHPLLQSADFLQEGFRVEQDEAGAVAFQGVVYNEMKGAYEDPHHHAHQALVRALHRTTALGHDSGGDPVAIPGLTLATLEAFHRERYHPTHALVLTAGPLEMVALTQAALTSALADLPAMAPPAPRLPLSDLQGCQRGTARVPGTDEHQVIVAWPLGAARDVEALQVHKNWLQALFVDAGCPWQIAQERQGLGRIGALQGSLTLGEEHWLVLHLEGLTAEEVPAAEALIQETLRDLVETGVDARRLAATLRDFTIVTRLHTDTDDMGAAGRFLDVAELALYHPEDEALLREALDPLSFLPRWAERAQSAEAARAWVQHLAEPARRLVLHLQPEAQFQVRRHAAEIEACQAWADHLRHDGEAQARLTDEHRLLQEAAGAVESLDCLPSTAMTEIPTRARPWPALEPLAEGVVAVPVPLQGVGELALIAEAGHLPPADGEAMVQALRLLTDVGMGGHTWAEALALRNQAAAGLSAHSSAAMDAQGHLRLTFELSGLALSEGARALAQTLGETLLQARWDETDRIAYLLTSETEQTLAELPAHADRWVQKRAQATLTAMGAWEEGSQGLTAVRRMVALQARLDHAPEAVGEALRQAHARLLELTWTVVATGAAEDQAVRAGALALQAMLQQAGVRLGPLHLPRPAADATQPKPVAVALVATHTDSRHHQVGWAVPGETEPAAAALMALGPLLTQSELWPRLRGQGGAYGASARYRDGTFGLVSYRDPRFGATFADFQATVERAMRPFPPDAVAQAQRGIFQRLDRPVGPLQEASQALRMAIQGRTTAQRQALRDRLLALTPEAIRTAAQQWLSRAPDVRVAYIPATEQPEAEAQGFRVEALPEDHG
jgi:Zn-dependent M16 (insulinase) family peptidase